MKKQYLLVLLIAITMLCGCAGLGDWSSEPLPGGYEVWRMNVHGIALIKPDETGNGGSIVIPEEVYAICYNDEYICAQHEEPTPDEKDYWKEPHGQIDYYILSANSGDVLGPYSEAEYNEMCATLQVGELCEWTLPKDLSRVE